MKLAGPLVSAAGVNVSVPPAFSVTEPLLTATEPPTAIAVPLIAVIVRPPFSKLSLVSALNVTAVSSLVDTASLAISTTGVTVSAIVSMSVAVPSVVCTVSVAGPA